jgi:hypothetical protein
MQRHGDRPARDLRQPERGRRGLSVDTLRTLSDRLGMMLDELLQASHSPGYRLGPRDHRRHTARDDPSAPRRHARRAGVSEVRAAARYRHGATD